MLSGEVTDASAQLIVAQLLFLDSEDLLKNVVFDINQNHR